MWEKNWLGFAAGQSWPQTAVLLPILAALGQVIGKPGAEFLDLFQLCGSAGRKRGLVPCSLALLTCHFHGLILNGLRPKVGRDLRVGDLWPSKPIDEFPPLFIEEEKKSF